MNLFTKWQETHRHRKETNEVKKWGKLTGEGQIRN